MATDLVTTVVCSHRRQVSLLSVQSSVTSAYGRVGDVVGEEGDYSIGQMIDVDISVTPSSQNLLQWDGSSWVPTSTVDGGVY